MVRSAFGSIANGVGLGFLKLDGFVIPPAEFAFIHAIQIVMRPAFSMRKRCWTAGIMSGRFLLSLVFFVAEHLVDERQRIAGWHQLREIRNSQLFAIEQHRLANKRGLRFGMSPLPIRCARIHSHD